MKGGHWPTKLLQNLIGVHEMHGLATIPSRGGYLKNTDIKLVTTAHFEASYLCSNMSVHYFSVSTILSIL